MTGTDVGSDGVSHRRLILASASRVRSRLLGDAGLPHDVCPAHVDEGALKKDLTEEGCDGNRLALGLARAKGAVIAGVHSDAWIIAADQVLECEGMFYDKPANRAAAARQLNALQGKDHRLLSAVVLLNGEREVWSYVAAVTLAVRPLDEAAIESYLNRAGAGILESVGAYQLEGLGAQLFHRVDGDYFTVLGLPLLPLLDALRRHRVQGPQNLIP